MQEHCTLARPAREDGVVVFLNVHHELWVGGRRDYNERPNSGIRDFLYKAGFDGKGVPASRGPALEGKEGKEEAIAGVRELAGDLHAWILPNPMQSIKSAMD